MVKLNFTNRCVCPSLVEHMKLLTFLSTGYGRMGKNHTRNSTYTRGRLVAPYWFISIFFCYFPQLLYFLIHHHYCRPPECSSLLSLPVLLLIFFRLILGQREKAGRQRLECCGRVEKLNITLITPVLTARIIWSSASSEAPDVVCCVTAGIHGGGSYKISHNLATIRYFEHVDTYCSVWMRGRCIIFQLYDNGERYIILNKSRRLSSKTRPGRQTSVTYLPNTIVRFVLRS
jgi:hypothetical protein